MFTDERRSTYWELVRQRDLRQFSEILTPRRLARAAVDANVAVGRGALNLFTLTWLAVGGAWHTGHSFAGVLMLVFKLLQDAGRLPEFEPGPGRGSKSKSKSKPKPKSKRGPKAGRRRNAERSKHDPRGTGAGVTEEAFVQARAAMPDSFWVALILILGEAFDQKHAPLTRIHGLRLVALDGTCINLPRWKALISYRMPGFRPSAIVTNQTDPGRLSREQWLGLGSGDAAGDRLGGGLYHRRWGIETTFAELKVRQKMEGSIRGRTPAAVRFEVAGHVLLYLMTRWLMVEAAQEHGLDPLRLSFTNALREIKDMHQTMLTAEPGRVESALLPLLLERIAGHRVPERPGRHYPRPNETKVKNKGRGKRQLPSKLRA